MSDLNRTTVEEKVIDAICDGLSVDKEKVVRSASFIEDLKVDSLDIVELVMSLEDEFDISISDDEAAQLKTVGDVIDFVVKKRGL